MNQNELFEALGARTPEDLLRHFPTRYESLRLTPMDRPPVDGKRYVLKGVPTDIKTTPNKATSIIRFRFSWGEDNIRCLIVNQSFYMPKLQEREELVYVLYYSDARKVFVVSAIYSPTSLYVISGIKPCYSLPKGVSSSYFANTIRKFFSNPEELDYFQSPLPPRYTDKYRLEPEGQAFRDVHLPLNEKARDRGLRVFKYEEALSYCTHVLLLKQEASGRKRLDVRPVPHDKINAFVRSLPYKLTKDQLLAIREIILDMESPKVMFRLLQGDVGTGKTIVCFTALYGNYLRGKQGVLMAPTYELSQQHFRNAEKVFAGTGMKVGFLASGMPARKRKELLDGLKEGSVDLLVSTVAALSKDVIFHDLGLTAVDEQQLFGVGQREELLKKGSNVDFLMMSATPIPRTLSQVIQSDVDVSTLSQFPHGSRLVRSEVLRSSDPLLEKAVKKALEAGRQIFVITPKIESGTTRGANVEEITRWYAERFGKEKVQSLHGRIRKEEQDRIYQAFLSGEKPILVSTTVIEVGIDVSSAGLLIVYDANDFGLSTLHQLRGRIGRSGDFALALFLYDGQDRDDIDKLKFLAENSDGMKIAEYDLRTRGAGAIGGEEQSGKNGFQLANPVSDLPVFQAAKEDALEILRNPTEKENAEYLRRILGEKKTFVA